MVVRFDSKALKQTVDHKIQPIGVEGDPSSQKGGISEADAIVKEARKSMSEVSPSGGASDEDLKPGSNEIIMEEADKEPGPLLNPNSS